MDDVMVAKLCALIIVLVISVILGNVPYFVLKRRQTPEGTRRRNLIISIFNAFSGGVFLGTCLLHLMVEGREELESAFTLYKVDIEYPLFDVLVAFGFFVITFVDFVADQCFRGSNSTLLKSTKVKTLSATNPTFSNTDETIQVNLEGYRNIDVNAKPQSENKTTNTVESSTNPEVQITSTSNGGQPNTDLVISQRNLVDDHQHAQGHDHEFDDLAKASTIRAVLLLIALSFHTVFDGLAIGLQNDEAGVWAVLAGISVHKALVAFCLGLKLYQAYKERTKMAIVFVQLFCVISPIGIAIGIIVTSAHINAAVQTMTSAILQGIAAGTFLYVTFFEILNTAFTHGQSIWNIVVASVGFGAMAGVKVLDSD